jgi:DNA polymerase III delta prime subunit
MISIVDEKFNAVKCHSKLKTINKGGEMDLSNKFKHYSWRAEFEKLEQSLSYMLFKKIRVREFKNQRAKTILQDAQKTFFFESQPWVDKYKPESSKAVLASRYNTNKYIVNSLFEWLKNWGSMTRGGHNVSKRTCKKSVLLSGPTGIGKTTIVHIISRELGYDVLELGPLDLSCKSELEKKSHSDISNTIDDLITNCPVVFNGDEKRVLIIDDIENTGVEIIKAFYSNIFRSKIPIVFISRNKYDPRIKALRSLCLELNFRRHSKQFILETLLKISANENLSISVTVLDKLAKSSNGDLKFGINQLQTIPVRNEIFDINIKSKKNFYEVLEMLTHRHSGLVPLQDRLDYISQHRYISPAIIMEKCYKIRHTIASSKEEKLWLLSKICNVISAGDMLTYSVTSKQKWGLIPFVSVVGIVYPMTYARNMRYTAAFGVTHKLEL